jgi:phosphonate transport system ATP-binding protein
VTLSLEDESEINALLTFVSLAPSYCFTRTGGCIVFGEENEMEHGALQVDELHTIYPDGTHAVRGVSFTVQPGELVAVIGASGAGKSTLMRNVNRLVNPTSGRIRFYGQDVTAMRKRNLRKVRREIGMIFQHHNLVHRLSAVHNVLHGNLGYMSALRGGIGHFNRREVEYALEILVRVGLSEQAFKRADELSGGQKQRVGLARAICQRPRLLLADEPIASLDPAASARVMQYLRDICTEDQITSVVSLHQVDYARSFATRMIGMRDGELFFDGKPEQWTEAMIAELYE